MDIEIASQELFSKLRTFDEVVGVGVRYTNDIRYIVVFLAKISNNILKKIPNVYKGNIVKTEITGQILLQ